MLEEERDGKTDVFVYSLSLSLSLSLCPRCVYLGGNESTLHLVHWESSDDPHAPVVPLGERMTKGVCKPPAIDLCTDERHDIFTWQRTYLPQN